MANIIGNQDGIKVLNKLHASQDKDVQEYFQRMYKNVHDGKTCIYFSDFEEQKKKRLNNQITYKMFYDFEKTNWAVEVFSVPTLPK